VDVSVVAGIG